MCNTKKPETSYSSLDPTILIGDESRSRFGFAVDKNAAAEKDILICMNIKPKRNTMEEVLKVIV